MKVPFDFLQENHPRKRISKLAELSVIGIGVFVEVGRTVTSHKSTEPKRKTGLERAFLLIDGLSESKGSKPRKPNSGF